LPRARTEKALGERKIRVEKKERLKRGRRRKREIPFSNWENRSRSARSYFKHHISRKGNTGEKM